MGVTEFIKKKNEVQQDTRRTVLFIDDEDVFYRAGTKRAAVKAVRCEENPVIQGEARPWEGWLGWSSVHYDSPDGEFKLWYQSFNGMPASDPLSCVICVATSQDGILWERPELNDYPYQGSPTNIVVVGNGGYSHRYSCSVIEDPLRTFGVRFVMAYYDFGIIAGAEYPGLHLAHSENGLNWTRVEGGPFVKTAYGIRNMDLPLQGSKRSAEKPWAVPLTMSDAIDIFFDETTPS